MTDNHDKLCRVPSLYRFLQALCISRHLPQPRSYSRPYFFLFHRSSGRRHNIPLYAYVQQELSVRPHLCLWKTPPRTKHLHPHYMLSHCSALNYSPYKFVICLALVLLPVLCQVFAPFVLLPAQYFLPQFLHRYSPAPSVRLSRQIPMNIHLLLFPDFQYQTLIFSLQNPLS